MDTNSNEYPMVYIEVAHQDGAFFEGTKKGDICIRAGSSGQSLYFGAGSNSKPTMGINNSNVFVTNAIGVGGLNTNTSPESFNVNNGNALFNSNMYVMGRIGVGTTTPSESLDISTGNTKMNSNLFLLGSASIGLDPAVPTETLDIGSNVKVRSNAYVMRRLAVATSNPTEAVDISGNLKVSQSLYCVTSTSIGSSNPREMLDVTSNAIIRSNVYVVRNIGIGTSNPTEALDVVNKIKVRSDAYIVGNTGIGTSNPTEKVDVFDGNARLRSNLYVGNRTSIGQNNVTPTETLDVRGNTKITSNLYVLSNTSIGGSSNPSETLDVNGTIKAMSNVYAMNTVGIGTSNPIEKLHVEGNIFASTNVYAFSNLGVGTTLPTERIDNIGNSKLRGDVYMLSRASVGHQVPTETFDVRGNEKISSNLYVLQNVGIRTSNPQQPLHVIGNARIEGNLDVTGIYNTISTDVQITDQFTVSNNGTGPALNIYQMGVEPIADFYDDSLLAVRIADGGSVGINTPSPLEKLHVVGKMYTTQQCLGTSTDTSSSPSFSFLDDSNTGMFHASNNAVGFATGGQERMRITNGGAVGIGTTSPISSFDVIGTSIFSNALTTYNGTTTHSNNLVVSGSTTLCNSLNVSGATTLSNTLVTFNGTTIHSNALNVTGAMTLCNTLNVSGATTLSNTLVTFNGTTIHSNALNVTGAMTLCNTLNVSGATTLSNTLVTFNGTTIHSNALNVTGITTLCNSLNVSGQTNLSNAVVIFGSTTLSNILNVSGIIQGPTITSLSNLGMFASNTLVATSNTSYSLSNYVYTTGLNAGTTSDYASNTATWSSNNLLLITGDTISGQLTTSNNSSATQIQLGPIPREVHIKMTNTSNANAFIGIAYSNTNLHVNAVPNDMVVRNDTGRILLNYSSNGVGLVNSNNNIGIGTTTPSFKLDVSGTINSTGNISGPTITSLSNLGLFASNTSVFGSNTSTNASNVSFSLSNYVYGTNTTNITTAQTTANWGSNAGNFSSNNITSIVNTSVRTSNLGVGTLNPIERLQVIGKINSTVQILGSSNDTETLPSFSFINDSNTGIFSASNACIGFTTNGVERMRIRETGNVGVGISNPSSLLDVNGTAQFRNNVSLASTVLYLRLSDTNYGLQYNATFDGPHLWGTSGGGLGTNSTTATLRWRTNGIGVLLPSGTSNFYTLDVRGNAGFSNVISFSNMSSSNTPVVGFEGGTGDRVVLYRGSATTHPYSLGINQNAIWQSVPTGAVHQWYVGGSIGMTLSNNQLDVNGNSRINSSFIGDIGFGSAFTSFTHCNNISTTNYAILHQNDGTLYINSATGKSILFRHNNIDQMALSNGILGIGTSSPNSTYKLHVVGKIFATDDVIGFSDRRLKYNLNIIDNALSKIHEINGYTFNIRSNQDKKTGLIAQEVFNVLPEAVYQNDDGYYSLAYGNMAGIFVEAIKELDRKYDQKIINLQQQVDDLTSRLEKIM
jgi:uncharacterized membrane protein